MRNNFFGKAGIIFNPLMRSAGVVLIDPYANKDGKLAQVKPVLEALIDGQNILVYPARTRSKTGEIFYQNGDANLSNPSTIPRLLFNEIKLIPSNYTYNPVSKTANVRLGEPILFSPWQKEKGKRNKYFESYDTEIYDNIKEMTTVNMLHLISAYVISEGCTKIYCNPGELFNAEKDINTLCFYLSGGINKLKNIGIKSELETKVILDEDITEFRFEETLKFMADMPGIRREGNRFIFSHNENDLNKPYSIRYYANQIKHISSINKILEYIKEH
jgi:hypothetical protein